MLIVTFFFSPGCFGQSDSQRRSVCAVERLHAVLRPTWTTHCANFHLLGTNEQVLPKICARWHFGRRWTVRLPLVSHRDQTRHAHRDESNRSDGQGQFNQQLCNTHRCKHLHHSQSLTCFIVNFYFYRCETFNFYSHNKTFALVLTTATLHLRRLTTLCMSPFLFPWDISFYPNWSCSQPSKICPCYLVIICIVEKILFL